MIKAVKNFRVSNISLYIFVFVLQSFVLLTLFFAIDLEEISLFVPGTLQQQLQNDDDVVKPFDFFGYNIDKIVTNYKTKGNVGVGDSGSGSPGFIPWSPSVTSVSSTLVNRVISDYLKYHDLVIQGKLPPRILEVIPHTSAGVGNRLEQVQAGFLFAVLSGRAVLVNWSGYRMAQHFNGTWPVSWSLDHMSIEKQNNFSWKDYPRAIVREHDCVSWMDPASIFHNETVLRLEFDGMANPWDYIYTHAKYKDRIPLLLGEWKRTMMKTMLRPVDKILQKVEEFKQGMMPYNVLITAHMRTFLFLNAGHRQQLQSNQEPDIEQFKNHLDCIEYFNKLYTEQHNKVKIFFVADWPGVKGVVQKRWGDQVHFSPFNPIHSGSGGRSDTEIFSEKATVDLAEEEGVENVLFDWWMIGEGEVMLITSSSSYSFMAAMRSEKERFMIGGLTQCVNPDKNYYMEKIYKPTYQSWLQTGQMKFYPLQ